MTPGYEALRVMAMPGPRGRRILLTLVVVAVVAVALYAAAGFLLAPRLVERQLAALGDQRLGQKISMDTVKVNPFTLSIEIIGLRVAQGDQPPLLAAKRAYVDVALLRSGFGRGWVLSEVHCDGLQVLMEAQKNGRLNVADLAERWQRSAAPAKKTDAPLRFTINHLLASDGKLTYRELSDRPAATQILPIRIELENLSTLPDREGRYTVSARFVEGGAVTWRGDLALQPLQSEGDLEVKGLNLATAWKFFRDQLRLGEPKGQITIATHYRFSYANNKVALALSNLRADAAGLSVAREGSSEPLLAVKTAEVREGTFDLARRSVVLPSVTLSNGQAGFFNNSQGVSNWSGLVRESSVTEEASARNDAGQGSSSAPPPWNFDVPGLKVESVALRYRDLKRAAPLDLQAGALHGTAGLTVVAADVLDVRLRDTDLRLEKVRLPSDAPAVQLTQIQVHGGSLDFANQKLAARQIIADGGSLKLERSADGSLPLAAMFQGSGAPEPAKEQAPVKEKAPWGYAVDVVQVQHLDVALSDRSFGGETIAYPLNEVSARIEHFVSGGRKPMKFTASARTGKAGSLAASGAIAPAFSRVDAKVKLAAIELSPLQPVIARYAAVDLASGNASAWATVTYQRGDEGNQSLRAVGPFQVDKLRLNEAGGDVRVLAWERLSSREARLTIGPDRLLIKQIIVDAPEVRIDISENRELNLAQLFKKREPAPADAQPAQPAQATQAAEKKAQFPIRIGELRLRDGTIDYFDRSLVLPFTTPITDFEGTAAGLANDSDRIAALQFEGKIGDFGAVQVHGRVDAFSPTTFTDLAASFQNVELPALSPYTATFLGRKIASGKLWVEMKLHIEDGRLTGGNDVTVHELALGEAVDTPTALKLPLDLAVALLTDSNGVIHTAVPVTGNVRDPKFDIGKVVREALAGIVKKIVSAPFRALAGLFHGDKDKEGDDLGGVVFEPGSAKLMPAEKEKLQNVAKAIEERPQLKLIVQAAYADADREALKYDLATREVAQALGRTLKPDEKPGPLVFENLATQRALERLVAKKTDPDALRGWLAQYEKKNGEARRAGMILRTPGDPEFYEALFEWLAQNEPVSDEMMQELAENRARAVIEALVAAGVDEDRLEPGPVKTVAQKKENENISVQLSLSPLEEDRAAAVPDRPEVTAQTAR